MAEDKNLLDKLKDKGKATIEGLKRQYGIGQTSNPWPQTGYSPITGDGNLQLYPKHKTRGFLPPAVIPTNLKGGEFKIGQYSFKDWRGYSILENQGNNTLETKDRFDKSISIPKSDNELIDTPYSTRDIYSIFNDNSTDYFRHGLHVIDNLTPIENPESGFSNLRLETFSGTPYEQNDPVIFGFDIIIDDVTSPLLNGSILDFLRNYNNVSEISSRIPVYEDFKQQFIKFFKTKSTVSINPETTTISKMRQPSTPEATSRDNFFQDMGKKSYMNYYLKKVSGLDKLIEQNTPSAKKFLVDYNKDIISLSFSEDVTLSVGTLAHLYKLLYWSKPNGKGIVPENLLRFNCDIIVSEIRNYNRVITTLKRIDDLQTFDPTDTFSVLRDISSGKYQKELKIIKDNVSRYVYSLRECQFYFNILPHNSDIDMGGTPTAFGEGSYPIQFDYKYSTVKLERFVPKLDGSGEGEYVGYDGGAMWRIGSPGARESRIDPSIDTSNFFTKGENKFNQNGVNTPFIINIPNDNLFKRIFEEQNIQGQENLKGFERFKKFAKAKAKELGNRLVDTAIQSAQRELQFVVNTRVAILNRSLNKILNANGLIGVRPPKNVYTDRGTGIETARGRIFYDIRGQLLNFTTDTLGSVLGGGRSRSF
jgi:hypothetical protein